MKFKRGFTLIEMLVVIGIISVLSGMLLPALKLAFEQGKSIACANNLKQIGASFAMYFNDNHGNWEAAMFSNTTLWYRHIGFYLDICNVYPSTDWNAKRDSGQISPFICPADPRKICPSYTMNGNTWNCNAWQRCGMDRKNIYRLTKLSQRCNVMDGVGNNEPVTEYTLYRSFNSVIYSTSMSKEEVTQHCAKHLNCANILYLDMHVKSLQDAKLYYNIANPNKIFFDYGQKNQ